MGLAEQIGNKGPRGSSWPAAFMTTGVAAVGGVLAGRVRGVIADLVPTFPGGGDLGVFVLATAMQKTLSESNDDWESIGRQLAAGMAGKVGDSVWNYLRGLLGVGVSTVSPRRPPSCPPRRCMMGLGPFQGGRPHEVSS